VGLAIMLIGIVIIFPTAPYLVQIFNNDPMVIQAGTTYLRIEVFAFLTYVFLNMNISVLQGIKKPNFALWIGMFRQFLPFALFYFLGTTLNLGISRCVVGNCHHQLDGCSNHIDLYKITVEET
jgi:Na+-driven multidrug efflux pump